ncbi:MAG: UDP-N-acetylmuramoyl-tripeptide--D-alanyl-D-alanine ligase [Chlorobi bacterium]|nr:UDP-N-acetylmuramoyl-tripeptide--D-alanyl-D-alanine ligase [Chlorobiota bacterium]
MTIPELYKLFLKYPKITTDSRKMLENSVFWALKGDKFNGNIFVQSALKSGAAFAVTDEKKYQTSDKVILVNNSLEALQQLANYHRKQLNVPIFALTGTNGKTTTKELINSVLSTQYKVKATHGNFNNHIGVPLTILSFDKNTEIGIVEMGANHPKEIDTLCKIVEPNFGLITNIGKAHLEGFGSFEKIIETKSELYQSLIKNNGTIFYNSDNPILRELNKGDKTVAYGQNDEAYLKGKITTVNPFLDVEIETFEGLKTEINSKLIGLYNFENILAASCVGDFFNISIQNIKKGIENYIPENNRSQIIKHKYNTIILDAYNANPASMKVSVNSFLESYKNNKILILGDMYELGKYSDNEHSKILKIASDTIKTDTSVKLIIVIGKYFKKVYTNEHIKAGIVHFNSASEAETFLNKNPYKGYTFLIKGSRAVKLEDILQSVL